MSNNKVIPLEKPAEFFSDPLTELLRRGCWFLFRFNSFENAWRLFFLIEDLC